MAQQRFKVRLVGKSPLLTHNPASMGVTKTGAKGERKIPTPEEEAKMGAYPVNGHFALPGIAIRNSFLQACGMWKVKIAGSKRPMSAKSVFAHLIVEPELVPILDKAGKKPLKEYTIDTRRAVVQRNGIMRSRPRFDEWSVTAEFVYDDTILTEEHIALVRQILTDAGQRIGVGDYRPHRSGWFGTFELAE